MTYRMARTMTSEGNTMTESVHNAGHRSAAACRHAARLIFLRSSPRDRDRAYWCTDARHQAQYQTKSGELPLDFTEQTVDANRRVWKSRRKRLCDPLGIPHTERFYYQTAFDPAIATAQALFLG